jgi:NAD(P) transhydrogenase subunit beta
MAIAIVTTLAAHPPAGIGGMALVVAGLAIGGGIGAVTRARVPMTSMPELVAAFHSLVGLAAVLVAAARSMRRRPSTSAPKGAIPPRPAWWRCRSASPSGAITFTGSLIAFLKLSGRMSGAPHQSCRPVTPSTSRSRSGLVFFVYGFVVSASHLDFWIITLLSFALGVLIIVPIGGADMPVVISMLNSYSGGRRPASASRSATRR